MIKTFRSKPDFMQHRKKQQRESVKYWKDNKVGFVILMRKSVGLFILNVRKLIHLT